MKENEIQDLKLKIDGMTHREMCVLYRFSPIGHSFFNKKNPISEYFDKKFKELGGMTPELSKSIGW